jgi:hypothetical protein
MTYRTLPLFLVAFVALALVLGTSAPVMADDTHDGTVVKAGDGKLTITGADKKDLTVDVAKDAKITCDGKDCKLEDLKKDIKVKVTTKKDGDKTVASKIEATTK